MELFRKQVEEAATYVRSRVDHIPNTALILGTGLGSVADAMEESVILPYDEIPNHPVSTVMSHIGRLIYGSWAGTRIMVMQGRFHLYEGYSPREISFPIRVFASLGIRRLIISNAAGGLNPLFAPGDLMLISDHINSTGHNPLVGPNVDEWGARFSDMTQPYSRRFQGLAMKTAVREKILLHRGIYVGVLGPSLETAAETRFLRTIGADAVGMSTVMEVITASHAGIEVLGISVITNVNLPDCYEPAPVEQIIATAENAGPKLARLLSKIIGQI